MNSRSCNEQEAPISISIEELVFNYPKSKQSTLDIKQWQLQQGEHIFLYGESGRGKSTLLSLLAGIYVPCSGSIKILGQEISQLSARKRDRFRAQHIGVVFQQFNLIPYLNVLDNILLAAHFAKGQNQEVLQRAKHLLKEVNLSEALLTQKASQLSIGQQQRVAIVRALINLPPILLVDEPTSALDDKNQQAFMDLLLSIVKKQHCTLVFVSHDQSLAHHFHHQVDLAGLNSANKQSTIQQGVEQ